MFHSHLLYFLKLRVSDEPPKYIWIFIFKKRMCSINAQMAYFKSKDKSLCGEWNFDALCNIHSGTNQSAWIYQNVKEYKLFISDAYIKQRNFEGRKESIDICPCRPHHPMAFYLWYHIAPTRQYLRTWKTDTSWGTFRIYAPLKNEV